MSFGGLRYFYCSDILQGGQERQSSSRLWIWAFQTFVLLSTGAPVLRPEATVWSISHCYEVQRQPGVVIRNWICCWWCLSYILSCYTYTHIYFLRAVPSPALLTRVITLLLSLWPQVSFVLFLGHKASCTHARAQETTSDFLVTLWH